MANISTYLEQIMAAIFGKDVRKSIHDAIDIINKVSEVTLLAGTDVDSPSSSVEGFYDGSLYMNLDEWELWRCTGTAWENLGKFGGHDGNSIVSVTKTGVDPDHANVDIYTITYSDISPTTFEITNGIDGTHGSVWYKGTALTGTGTTTGYPGVETDLYLNSSTGYIYQCIQTGDGTTARWDYVMAMSGGGGGASNLDDLGDVTLTSEHANQKLRNNGSVWINVDDDLWTSPQTCSPNDTTKTFTGCDPNRAYDAYFECANGVQSPAIISMHNDATTPTSIIVTFKPVTEEQAGGPSGTSCKLKLRGFSNDLNN